MKNLLQFLVRFNAIPLFWVFQAICFVLIINFNKEQSAIYTATKHSLSLWIENACSSFFII
jgi:hypothetical protein